MLAIAESKGFEPLVPLQVHYLSKVARSAALSTLYLMSSKLA